MSNSPEKDLQSDAWGWLSTLKDLSRARGPREVNIHLVPLFSVRCSLSRFRCSPFQTRFVSSTPKNKLLLLRWVMVSGSLTDFQLQLDIHPRFHRWFLSHVWAPPCEFSRCSVVSTASTFLDLLQWLLLSYDNLAAVISFPVIFVFGNFCF